MIKAVIAPDLAVVTVTGDMIGQGRGSEQSTGTAGAGAEADLQKTVDTVGVIAHRIKGVLVADIR